MACARAVSVTSQQGLQNQLDDLANKAFRDPINVPNYTQEGLQAIEAAGNDWLDRAEPDGVKAKFLDRAYSGAIKAKILKDPYLTQAELMAGHYDNKIDQQSLETLAGMASVEIERRKQRAEAERKEQVKTIGKAVDDYRTAVMMGFEWSGNERQLAAAVRGTEHEAEFIQTLRNAHELSTFALMGPGQQEQYLRTKAQTPKTGDEAQLYAKLEAAHAATKSALQKDPLTYAIRQRAIPPLMPFDLNNPASLKERSIAAGLVESRYGVPASPLSDEEAAGLTNHFRQLPAEGKAQAMKKLNDAFGPRQVQMIASQLFKHGQGEMAQAFGISSQVPEAARRIIEGSQIKRDHKETLPLEASRRAMDEAINRKLADAYKASPEAMDAAKEAIQSVYVWASWQMNDLSGSLNTKRLENAITTVTGGVLNFNGSNVLPPKYGVDEKQFRRMIEQADYSQIYGQLGAKDILASGQLTSVGPGRYLVTIGGRPVFQQERSALRVGFDEMNSTVVDDFNLVAARRIATMCPAHKLYRLVFIAPDVEMIVYNDAIDEELIFRTGPVAAEQQCAGNVNRHFNESFHGATSR